MTLPEFEALFRVTLMNLRMLGLSLTEDTSIPFLFIMQMFNLFLIIIEETCFLISRISADNLLILTNLASCTFHGTTYLFKACFLFIYRKKTAKLMNDLEALYKEVTTDEDNHKLVESNINFVIKLCKYCFILNQILIWMFNISNLPTMAIAMVKYGRTEYILPFAVSLPFEVNTWIRWTVVYIHSFIAGIAVQLCMVGVESLYYALTTSAVVHFTRICHRLEHLTPESSSELPDIVRRHQQLIQLTRNLEEIFSPSMLIHLVLGGLEVCLLGFNVIASDLAQLPQFLVFLTSELLAIFMLCLFGNLLMAESERVGYSAYLCNWYDMDKTTKRMLIIIRERARRPQTLTAMRFSTVAYGSFSKIISTAWSYFTILNTFYSPKEN